MISSFAAALCHQLLLALGRCASPLRILRRDALRSWAISGRSGRRGDGRGLSLRALNVGTWAGRQTLSLARLAGLPVLAMPALALVEERHALPTAGITLGRVRDHHPLRATAKEEDSHQHHHESSHGGEGERPAEASSTPERVHLVLPSGAVMFWPPLECPGCHRETGYVTTTPGGVVCAACAAEKAVAA